MVLVGTGAGIRHCAPRQRQARWFLGPPQERLYLFPQRAQPLGEQPLGEQPGLRAWEPQLPASQPVWFGQIGPQGKAR